MSLYCPLVAMTAKYKPPLNRNKNYCIFFIYVLVITANLSIILFQNARILRFLSESTLTLQPCSWCLPRHFGGAKLSDHF